MGPLKALWGWALIAMLFFCGCGGGDKPFQPLGLSELPDALMTGFAKADPTARMHADFVASNVRSNQWAQASIGLNDLVSFPKLTKEERKLASRAQMTVNQQIRLIADQAPQAGPEVKSQTVRTTTITGAAAPGSSPEEAAQAAQALRFYQQTK
jgi:hypothetical protein